MKIEFVISHYIGRTYQLIMVISAIISQTNPNWKIHVVCNGPVDDLDFIKNTFRNVPNIRYSILDKHYDDWGHEPKNYGIRAATEDWIVTTSNDNYYVPVFVDTILKSVQNNPQTKFVYTDMIHNHYNYTLFKCRPQINYIDIGNMVTKPELSKQILFDITQYAADGIFAEEYIKKFCKDENILYIPNILYVHN